MSTEFWLDGPVPGVSPELQPVAHSLLQSRRELERALGPLSVHQLNARAGNAATIGFHARHIAGSIDRLMTYTRGEALSPEQRATLADESTTEISHGGTELYGEVRKRIDEVLLFLDDVDASSLNDIRHVGSMKLPSTVRGLLFHIAEHTLMHAAQIRTTALVLDMEKD